MKMKYVCLLALIIMIVGFKVENVSVTTDSNKELQGTWQLVSEKYGEDGTMSPPQYGYVKTKLITGKHFAWSEYDKDGKLISVAGGTYSFLGATYTENIEYYYPSGSSLLGASIPFQCTIDGDSWLHSGYLQEREINGETGEYTVSNTERLSEVWKRIK